MASVQLIAKMTGDAKGMVDAFGKGEKASGKLGSALGGVAKIASGFVIGAGLLKLPGLLSGAAQAAAEDEAATMRLNKALDNYIIATGGGAEETQELIGDMNERILAGQKLAFTDDDVRDSMQKLLAATGDYGEATKRSTAAMDLARGANIPLAEASKLLGKINAENVEVFKRMGITLGENATEADALAFVQEKFGGQADAYAKSTAGQMEQAKIRMAELHEQIGGFVLPIMTALGGVLINHVVPAVEGVGSAIGDFIDDIKWILENGAGFNEKLSSGPWADLAEKVGVLAIWMRDTLVPALKNDVLPMLERLGKDVLGALADSFRNDVQPVLEAFVRVLKDPLLPALASIAVFVKDELLPQFVKLGKWLADHKEVVVAAVAAYVTFQVALMAVAALQFATVVIGVTTAFLAMTQAVGFATAAQTLLNIAMTANPIGLVVVAIAALVAGAILVWQNWDHITEALGRFADAVHGKVGGAFSALGSGVKSAVNWIIDMINGLIGAWNRLQFTVSVPFGGPSFSVGTPWIDPITPLARGGIVRARAGGTLALLGEGGRDEAVVPLGSGGYGGGTYVTINIQTLDGQSAADATVRALSTLERQGRISAVTVVD